MDVGNKPQFRVFRNSLKAVVSALERRSEFSLVSKSYLNTKYNTRCNKYVVSTCGKGQEESPKRRQLAAAQIRLRQQHHSHHPQVAVAPKQVFPTKLQSLSSVRRLIVRSSCSRGGGGCAKAENVSAAVAAVPLGGEEGGGGEGGEDTLISQICMLYQVRLQFNLTASCSTSFANGDNVRLAGARERHQQMLKCGEKPVCFTP
jgi:hypothetical protein